MNSLDFEDIVVDLDLQQEFNFGQKLAFVTIVHFIFTPDCHIQQKMQALGKFSNWLLNHPSVETKITLRPWKVTQKLYESVALGGTFDRLHLGHQALLLKSALNTKEQLHIGISGQALLANKKNKYMLQSFEFRTEAVRKFLQSIRPDLKLHLFELKDPYGPAISLPELSALVVSPETIVGGQKINKIRQEKGFLPLQIIICSNIAENHEKIDEKLSSSSLRNQLLKINHLSQQNYKQYKGIWDNLIVFLDSNKDWDVWWQTILRNYSQYWRFYHTNHHIYQLLKAFESKQFEQIRLKLDKRSEVALLLAIFFHDLVYRPDRTDNQEQSALLARQFLNQIRPQDKQLAQIVSQLIIETKTHEPSTILSQILFDLDMGILDSTPQDYEQYAKNIRKQYEPLLGETFPQKRIAFLSSQLQKEVKFSFQAHQWRKNMEWEIKQLNK